MVFLACGNLRGDENMSRFNKIDMDKPTMLRNAAADYSNSGIRGTDEHKGMSGEMAFICSRYDSFMKMVYLSATQL